MVGAYHSGCHVRPPFQSAQNRNLTILNAQAEESP